MFRCSKDMLRLKKSGKAFRLYWQMKRFKVFNSFEVSIENEKKCTWEMDAWTIYIRFIVLTSHAVHVAFYLHFLFFFIVIILFIVNQ